MNEMLYWYGGQVLSVGTDDMTPKEILGWRTGAELGN
jgi:hypothetical protein